MDGKNFASVKNLTVKRINFCTSEGSNDVRHEYLHHGFSKQFYDIIYTKRLNRMCSVPFITHFSEKFFERTKNPHIL